MLTYSLYTTMTGEPSAWARTLRALADVWLDMGRPACYIVVSYSNELLNRTDKLLTIPEDAAWAMLNTEK